MIPPSPPQLRRARIKSGLASYGPLLTGMLQAMRRQPQLAMFNTAEPHDTTHAILGAWARVCDILRFYQERLADEGYLETATEPESVTYLAEAVGTQRRGAISARVPLALTLLDIPGQPDWIALAPGRGLTVQNLPDAGQAPVVFECDEAIELRRAWNSFGLQDPKPVKQARLEKGMTSLLLQGTATGIRIGDGLIIGLASADGQSCFAQVRISDLQPDRVSDTTLAVWNGSLPKIDGKGPHSVKSVQRLASHGGLFGRTAQPWDQVPAAQRDSLGACPGGVVELERDPKKPVPWLWRKPQAKSPPGPLRQVFKPLGAALLAGTANGIVQADDQGGWISPAMPPGRHDVRAFAQDGAGRLYAGTAAGLLLQSVDGGASWAELRIAAPLVGKGPSTGIGLTGPIHCLSLDPAEPAGNAVLIAGTDLGCWSLRLDQSQWESFNSSALPGYDKNSKGAGLSVFALCRFKGQLVAATSQGLFNTGVDEADWSAAAPGPSGQAFLSLAVSSDGKSLFVGGSHGIVATPDLSKWFDFNKLFDPTALPVTSLAVHGTALFAAGPAGIQASRVEAAHWWPVSSEDLALFKCSNVLAAGLADKEPLPELLAARLRRAGIDFNPTQPAIRLFTALSGAVHWQVVGTPQAPGSAQIELRITVGERVRVSLVTPLPGGPMPQLHAADGRLFAVTASGPAADREWPYFLIERGLVALNRRLDSARVNDEVLLDQIGGSPAQIVDDYPLLTVKNGQDGLIGGFGRKLVATQLQLDDKPDLVEWDLRQTELLRAEGIAAALASPRLPGRPFTASEGTFAIPAEGLTKDRKLVLSGPRAALVVLSRMPGQPGLDESAVTHSCALAAQSEFDQGRIGLTASAALAAAGMTLSRNAQVLCLRPAHEWLLRDGDSVWHLRAFRAAHGITGITIAPLALYEVLDWAPEIRPCRIAGPDGTARDLPDGMKPVWLDPASWQQDQAEQVVLKQNAEALPGQCARLTFTAPVATPFAKTALKACANVAMASQGEMVSGEVLGSASGNRKAKRFRLARPQLAHVIDEADGVLRPQLAVVVNGPPGTAQLRDPQAARRGERWFAHHEAEPGNAHGRSFSLTTDAQGHSVLDFGDAAGSGQLPPGREHVTAHYRSCAGANGNVAAGTLKALRSRPPGIRRVNNPLPASGGADPEVIDALRRRAPRRLSYAKRIVTLDDYAAFAAAFPDVEASYAELISPGKIVLTVAVPDGWRRFEALAGAIAEVRADRLDLTLVQPLVRTFGLALQVQFQPHVSEARVLAQLRAVLVEQLDSAAAPIGVPVSKAAIARLACSVIGIAAAEVDVSGSRSGEPPAMPRSREPGKGAVQFRLDPDRLRIAKA